MGQENVKLIVEEFNKFSDWEDRYKHLIELGKSLPSMGEELKTDSNKIKGCQSQVWLNAELKGDKIIFSADSDASIVKGLIALMVKVYSGLTPDEVLAMKPTFLEEIGLKEHLSMSRANGLTAMMKQISFYAMAFKVKLANM